MAEITTYSGVAPYLSVHDGKAAIAFYVEAFGAQETERYDHEGRVGHATLHINGCDVMLADDYPEYVAFVGVRSPQALGGSTVTINLSVDDVDAWFARAIAAGAHALRPPKDEFYGRSAKLRDPFGHVWGLTGPKPAA